MATITIGKLTEFDPRTDSITAYVERVNLYFQANEVADGKKVAVFLSTIGSKTYAVLRNLTAPTAPADKLFAQLVENLTTHYEPKPLVITERFAFHKRPQRPQESVKDFAAELRRLTIHCAFGAHLEEALRDRFVSRLYNETMQKRLLTEKDLMFTGAIDIAHGTESVAYHAKALQGGAQSKEVHKLNQHSVRGEAKQCYKCGQSSHRPTPVSLQECQMPQLW